MNFKRLTLTDITIDIKRVPKKKTLIAAMEAAGGHMFSSFEAILFFFFLSFLFNLYSVCCQMSRTSGRTAPGAGS